MLPAIVDPHWTSLLPPIVAIALALISRQVIFSLFVGVFTGALIVNDWNPLVAFLDLIGHYIVPALADPDHAAIIIFSMMLGGLVGVVSKSGGAMGIVRQVEKIAHSARMGQVATWLMGILIFFDDYANTLIVGNTMRPVTDRFRISHEKLAFIVDSTAAPVACMFLSTWIGYELGVIGDSLKGTGFTDDPFSIFVMSIPYRFYAILAILFVGMVVVTKRDFGPMLSAERRARKTGELVAPGSEPAADLTDLSHALPEKGVKARWINGVLPIMTVIVVSMIGLWRTGHEATVAAGLPVGLRTILAHSSSSTALFWGSLSGCVIAIALSVSQRILTLHHAMEAWFSGVKSMLLAMIILILAWSIGAVTHELGSAEYIVHIIGGTMPFWMLPAITFILAGFISFATGTSWGSMAILMPLIVPLTWDISQKSGMDMAAAHNALYISVSAVLAGAIWGDHCSPISDTTVMSSMASACDHIDHVRTQIPYAVVVGIVSVLFGYIPAAAGFSPWLSLALSLLVLFIILILMGRKSDGPVEKTLL
jgi:Na+/H+ antiporter NhaC